MNCVESKTEFNIKCNKINEEINCIELRKNGNELHLRTSYLIGMDYLVNNIPFIVEPKFEDEKKDFSVNFYDILFKSLPFVKSNEDISDLYFVDFSKPTIEINQQDDFLTPILIIQFITYLDKICHAGLQKGYYWIEENLDNKVKGKILVKNTIKYNHLKAKYTKTYCRYQEFGINTSENQFLKYTFQFCLNYLNQFKKLELINNLESKLGFIRSTFQKVRLNLTLRNEIVIKKNPLFPQYENALKLSNLILKRNSFNITNTTNKTVATYPYWINMSKLFEIHVLRLLRTEFKEGVYFQKEYAGRIPDIVINRADFKAIIDVKYKPYAEKSIDIEDIRQVAAYAKMKPIFKELKLKPKNVLDAVIVYPKVNSKNVNMNKETLNKKQELTNYFNIYALDVAIPIISKP
ncbi:5-methylcytosine restriction system specificity protein McrC [Lacinutrix sp. MEBiC02404]